MKKLLFLIAILFIGTPTPAKALLCNISVSDIAFNNVDVLSGSTVDTTGTVNVSCIGVVATTTRLCLNIHSGAGGADIISRKMLGPGGAALRYQFYKDAARTQLWGSTTWGLGGSPLQIDLPFGLSVSASTSATIYARVTGGQSTVSAGAYASAFGSGQTTFAYATLALFDCNSILGLPPLIANVSFNVTGTVINSCAVTAQNIDFGSRGVINANVDADGQVSVTCTPDAAYTVGLSNGNTGTSPVQRKMVHGAEAITYGLYQNTARTQPWGGTAGTNTVAGTGTGTAQNIPVYGRVPAQHTPAAGTYLDTVVVTVTY